MNKLFLANLPTKIQPLRKPPTPAALWIKRDDQTGLELSGNKVRKLEYALREALDQKADTVITCGGIQSNHARATAASCARLGLRCILLLQDDGKQAIGGNYFLSLFFGAEIVWLDEESYQNNLHQHCLQIAEKELVRGYVPYIMPIGASNGIGTFGYVEAYEEIAAQEKEMGICFDALVVPVGSGGTYTGLLLGDKISGGRRAIIGIPIAKNATYFNERIRALTEEYNAYRPRPVSVTSEDILLLDGWAGPGYAKNTEEDFLFIRDFARNEGILLDPTYTGKAMRGLYESLQAGHPLLKNANNILFIHTGGAFGLFGKEDDLIGA